MGKDLLQVLTQVTLSPLPPLLPLLPLLPYPPTPQLRFCAIGRQLWQYRKKLKSSLLPLETSKGCFSLPRRTFNKRIRTILCVVLTDWEIEVTKADGEVYRPASTL